jgi:hypothetical protein
MAAASASLRPEETRLVGQWLFDGQVSKPDTVTERIDSLVRNSLVRLASDKSGWDTLYRDPTDGRLWELLYLQSERHGGGPPCLVVIEQFDAAQKYGAVVPSNKSLERTREG